jgi:2-amino-4-hydroxy-6-hydroxymethyldihydropteridine diphosphokinase
MPEIWRYAIAVGANLGDRQATIERAACLLDAGGMARVVARSPLIGSAAVGGPPGQGPYLNGAWVVASGFGAHQLLAELQRLESACGRVRTVHWGPRTLDLDLLLRDDGLVVASPVLTLPHPRLAERRFVLEPLAMIAPGWRVPGLGRTVAELAR